MVGIHSHLEPHAEKCLKLIPGKNLVPPGVPNQMPDTSPREILEFFIARQSCVPDTLGLGASLPRCQSKLLWNSGNQPGKRRV